VATDPVCNFDDESLLACTAPPSASTTPASAVCSPSDASTAPLVSGGTSALVQKYSRSDQPAVVASPTPSSSTTAAPGVIILRPDQVDLATGIPRVQAHATLGGAQLTASVDILNANAHLGSLNHDGSRGENIGAGANLLGGEIEIAYKGWSLTLGVAASLGGSISSGEGRDLDGDGVQERCFAMSLGHFTLGECDEL
jgi:hypothetical protein